MSTTVTTEILTCRPWTGGHGRGEVRRHGGERCVWSRVARASGDIRALLRELVLTGGEFSWLRQLGTALFLLALFRRTRFFFAKMFRRTLSVSRMDKRKGAVLVHLFNCPSVNFMNAIYHLLGRASCRSKHVRKLYAALQYSEV
jgi:hypothetical protein